jgi:hypothetical protein
MEEDPAAAAEARGGWVGVTSKRDAGTAAETRGGLGNWFATPGRGVVEVAGLKRGGVPEGGDSAPTPAVWHQRGWRWMQRTALCPATLHVEHTCVGQKALLCPAALHVRHLVARSLGHVGAVGGPIV